MAIMVRDSTDWWADRNYERWPVVETTDLTDFTTSALVLGCSKLDSLGRPRFVRVSLSCQFGVSVGRGCRLWEGWHQMLRVAEVAVPSMLQMNDMELTIKVIDQLQLEVVWKKKERGMRELHAYVS